MQDGDIITIDLDTRQVDADLTEAQWESRRAQWRAPAVAHDVGWLQQYRRTVGPLPEGAVLVRTGPAESN